MPYLQCDECSDCVLIGGNQLGREKGVEFFQMLNSFRGLSPRLAPVSDEGGQECVGRLDTVVEAD